MRHEGTLFKGRGRLRTWVGFVAVHRIWRAWLQHGIRRWKAGGGRRYWIAIQALHMTVGNTEGAVRSCFVNRSHSLLHSQSPTHQKVMKFTCLWLQRRSSTIEISPFPCYKLLEILYYTFDPFSWWTRRELNCTPLSWYALRPMARGSDVPSFFVLPFHGIWFSFCPISLIVKSWLNYQGHVFVNLIQTDLLI